MSKVWFELQVTGKLEKLTFLDYGEEGLFVLNLTNKEPNPYLICCLEFEEENYKLYHSESDVTEDQCWFQNEVNSLKLITSFDAHINFHNFRYMIFEVTDKQAYLNIWAMASHDLSIADYTVSGDCDIIRIIDCLKGNKYFDDEDFDVKLASWVYTQHYGGGSDEHHAVFYSKYPQNTDELLKQISEKDFRLSKIN